MEYEKKFCRIVNTTCNWENNIKIDLKEISWGTSDWIVLAEDRDKRWALVNAGMNLRVLQNVNFLTSTIFLTSQGHCSMELYT